MSNSDGWISRPRGRRTSAGAGETGCREGAGMIRTTPGGRLSHDITNRGATAWILSVFLFAFYIVLYFTEWLTPSPGRSIWAPSGPSTARSTHSQS